MTREARMPSVRDFWCERRRRRREAGRRRHLARTRRLSALPKHVHVTVASLTSS